MKGLRLSGLGCVRAFVGVAGLLSVVALSGTAARAAALPSTPLPGSIDAGRIDQRQGQQIPEMNLLPPAKPMQIMPSTEVPEQSKRVTVTLRAVQITGMTAFTIAEVEDIYKPYLDRVVTLDTVWMMAGQLTERYHNAGYFLSRIVVPQQEIKDGIIVLHAVEGSIGEIKLDDPLAQNRIVKSWFDQLLADRPIKADQIESVLLYLNDLPGVDLRAVLEPIADNETENTVRLLLEHTPAPFASGSMTFDNNSSRFSGPYEMLLQAQAVVLPTQKTTLAALSSLVSYDHLKYFSLKHEVPVFARGTLGLYGSYTTANPGYTLKPEEIQSRSTSFGAALEYSLIRQRQENLNAKITFESRDASTDILGTQLTRDYIRAARFGLNYQRDDAWSGQNALGATVSQGLPLLGASPAGQVNLSRAEAKPDFTKLNFDASRLQGLGEDWGAYTALTGQVSSMPLYSSEQFGYGGQAFGRAYDDSEIIGDQGVAVSEELRYSGIGSWLGLQPMPYGFYDIGAVWNKGPSATPYASGSAAGAGFRMFSDFGFSSNLGLAFPLTRRIANPLYGNGKSPRYFMQISYGF
jgi:hemolysin activation/secretion protein